MPYRFPRTFNEDYLRGLMKDARFANTYHPEHRAWHEQIAEGYKRFYPGPLKFDATGKMIRSAPATYTAPGTGGAVHVRAHLRHKNGKSVDVVDYWRNPPGKDGGDEGDGTDPNDRPPTDTERPIRRPLGQPNDRGVVPMSDAGGSSGETSGSGSNGENNPGSESNPPLVASPVENPAIRDVKAGYGSFGENREGGRSHNGIDLLIPPGGEVRSPVDGRIERIGDPYGDGRFTSIWVRGDDGNSYGIFYATPHDAEGNPLVSPGDRVGRGDVIGSAEDRASATPRMDNHIHFEIRGPGNRVIDPTPNFREWTRLR